MKKKLLFRLFAGLLGGIVISYSITIGISVVIGDGNYYPCVPSLIVSVLMMTAAYICEWMEHSVKGVLSYFVIFFAIFIVVWIVQYMIWKVRISKIKEGIQKNN